MPMDPRLQSTVRRYLGYGWRTSLIVSLVRFQFDAPIRYICVETLRRDEACPKRCAESCPLKRSERWFTPQFHLPGEK